MQQQTHDNVILELTVRNHPGVMTHVCGLFARRAFNVEGILCLPIQNSNHSRIWLLVNDDQRLGQMISQIENWKMWRRWRVISPILPCLIKLPSSLSKSLPHQAILFAIWPWVVHVLRVRTGFPRCPRPDWLQQSTRWDDAQLFAFRVRRDDFYRPVPAVRGIVCR